VVRLQPLLAHIQSFISYLEWYSFSHIYKKLNTLADELYKEALALDEGAFISQEYFEGQIYEEFPFLLYSSFFIKENVKYFFDMSQ
jgi:hypothetical protein